MGLREGLKRTRERLGAGLARLARGRQPIDDAALETVESLLLGADVGVEATTRILAALHKQLSRRELRQTDQLYARLRVELIALLEPVARPLVIPTGTRCPFVILMIGVNGTGKTTTIGKLARRLLRDGHSVSIAASDTFRAAAVAQVAAWGERAGAPVTARPQGGDPAAVAFEALERAKAQGTEVLLVDTAGRLHTQVNLMDQLKKLRRALQKLDPSAPHETLLVVDATTGQNALNQAAEFHQAVGLSGVCLTKLDGTAKGGVVFALAERLGLPIRYVGIGEGLEDLREFDAEGFVDALLGPAEAA